MSRSHLRGANILIVEDEPLIVLEMTTAFADAGMNVTSTNTVEHAKVLVENDGLTAATIDDALPDGDGAGLCARLKERGIPFLIYSGVSPTDAYEGAPFLPKPASEEALLDAVDTLIRRANASN